MGQTWERVRSKVHCLTSFPICARKILQKVKGEVGYKYFVIHNEMTFTLKKISGHMSAKKLINKK